MTVVGLLFLMMGAGLVVAEAHLPSHGALGVMGVTALVAGAIFALAGTGAGLAVAIPVAAIVAAAGGAGLIAVARKTGTARARRIRTGTEAMVGRVGVLQSWADAEGRVFVDGSLWRARRSWAEESSDGLHAGDRVVVERVSGLTLAVRRAEEWEVQS